MAKNPFKILREVDKLDAGFELAGDVAHSFTNDLIKEGSKDIMRELLGWDKFAGGEAHAPAHHASGDLQEGQEVSFSKEAGNERAVNKEPGIDYTGEIIHAETRRMQTENREISQRLEEIRGELTKLRQASKELESAFKDVTRETLTHAVKPGKYHLNFFEWVLSTIQNARVRIESSASWASALGGKKGKKDFWSLAQSHGTSYSMSSERAVAQQVG